jgi:outer membrane usher protein
VSQSGILTSVVNGNPEMVRLDTAYRYSDPDAVICYTAGDAINGGLAWTRPIRMGGLQGQRDFALRPDLVTMPLPNLGGTAAVPSTVDVYVNNARTFSQEIDAGPFLLTNIPMVTGAGNAQVVLRDSSGQATMTNIPFYGSPALLAPGLSSWSVEAGLPRLFYGSIDDTYAATPVASLTWRQGVFDSFTAEAHAEGGSGVANGGVGGVVRTGTMGVAAGAVAASRLGTGHGIQVAGSYEMSLGRLMFNVSSQRTFGDYEDLASASARLQATTSASPATSSGASPLNLDLYNSTRPPLALDRVMVGGPLAFDPASSWNASVIHEHDASDNVSDLASFSYARSLPFNVSLFATVYKNVGGGSNLGMIFGLTMPLGPSVSVSSSVSTVPGGAVGTLEASHSLGPEPGSVGWQMQDSEGAVPYRQAAVSYRSTYLTVQAGGYQSPLASGGNVGADGSIAIMGGDVFFSNRINDAFAVVDAGAPNVEVFYENQPVGTTDAHGMFLVPTLRSYQSNRISIDPAGLPVDAEMETTREIVTPADRAGALVAFKLHNDTMAALVILVRPDGSFVPVGSRGRAAGGEEFVVGYDGQAFIKHLSAANTLDVDLDDKTCHAAFNFQPPPGKQVRIGPVTCG